MAEFISYGQGGGEAMGFSLSEAGHSCPQVSGLNLEAKVFLKADK